VFQWIGTSRIEFDPTKQVAIQMIHRFIGQGTVPLLEKFATKTARMAGSKTAIGVAFAIVIIWAICGPIFDYSNTWQLAINTSTTIITFLMVFILQNSQNRESKALHAKLDYIIKSDPNTPNSIIVLETLSEQDLDNHLEKLAAESKTHSETDTH